MFNLGFPLHFLSFFLCYLKTLFSSVYLTILWVGMLVKYVSKIIYTSVNEFYVFNIPEKNFFRFEVDIQQKFSKWNLYARSDPICFSYLFDFVRLSLVSFCLHRYTYSCFIWISVHNERHQNRLTTLLKCQLLLEIFIVFRGIHQEYDTSFNLWLH